MCTTGDTANIVTILKFLTHKRQHVDVCVCVGTIRLRATQSKNQNEYGLITYTMTLLKSEQKTSMLITYEQLYLQTYHHNGHLIPEQSTGDPNPLLQLIIDTYHTTETTTNPNSAQYTS